MSKFLNWSFVYHSIVGNLHDDKEYTPVIIEFRDGRRFLVRTYSERDNEVVFLVNEDDRAPRVNEPLIEEEDA